MDDEPGGVDPRPVGAEDVPSGGAADLLGEDDGSALEVDIVDGDTHLARRGTLKHEAKLL